MFEEEIELDLALSIGGSFGKLEKLKPVKKVYALTVDSKSNGSDLNVKESVPGFAGVGELVDPQQAKREMHALRRQEAKRKREEKPETMKRGTCRAKNGEYGCEWGMEVEEKTQMQRQQYMSDVVHAVPFRAVAAPVQCVPFTNVALGGFPCVMTCWRPSGDGAFEPSTWQDFGPYNGNQNLGFNLSNGCDKDGVTGETASYGSTICGSSVDSEDNGSFLEGGGSSSDSRSRSIHSLAPLNGRKANDTNGHSENSASSEPIESDYGNNDSTISPKQEAMMRETEAKPSDNHISDTENSTAGSVKEIKIEMGKPLKPQTQNRNTPPLSQMPYVWTTGNGPNGKTVTGFLYRYTKSEVSIVCVCHGSTFSPAEFVQHAGGTDVSNPLRNITVIPSACG